MSKEVHIFVDAKELFDRVEYVHNLMCFRCGQRGHIRTQCHTYKTKMCTVPTCDGKNCTDAHHESELRQPWKTRCIRVVKHNGQPICVGCNSEFHTFRKCPYQKDFVNLC